MKSIRLDDASGVGRGANNFDLLRLFAATCVLFTHSFDLTGNTEPFPTRTGIGWSTIGVLTFFSISGFLVARSWDYDPRLLSFAVKRGLRLLPALVVSLLLTALLLGPFVTTLAVHTYLQDPGTKGYVFLNSTMWTFDRLPGVFTDNIYPTSVNGSLWTLSLEVKAYCLIAVIGLLGLFRRRSLLIIPVAAYFALLVVPSIRDALPLGNRAVATMSNLQAGPATIAAAKSGALLPWAQLIAAFAIGAALYSLRRWVPLRWDLAAVALVIWLGTVAIGKSAAAHSAVWLIPYLVLVIAYRTHHRVRLPGRFGDYSYGVYIYAFVVQQTVSHLFDLTSGWVMFLVATPITFVLAVLSWHFIEAPALTLKIRLATPLRAAEQAPHAASREALQPIVIP